MSDNKIKQIGELIKGERVNFTNINSNNLQLAI